MTSVAPRIPCRTSTSDAAAVERPHLVDRRVEVGVGRPALAPAAHEEARPEPLRQQQHVARARAALAEQPIGVRGADDREPVLRLRVADRVAAGEDAARLADLRGRRLEHRGERRLREVLGERGDRQREQHPAAHREHVRQRVGRGDLAVRDRVVDERREEVERAEDREVVRDAVRGGVVGRLEAGDERRVAVRARAQPGERIGQQVRPQLRGTAAALGELGQADRLELVEAWAVVIGRS